MGNQGNTGMRYKLRKIARFEIEGRSVRRVLECGHSTAHDENTPMQARTYVLDAREDIGKRTRCMECPV